MTQQQHSLPRVCETDLCFCFSLATYISEVIYMYRVLTSHFTFHPPVFVTQCEGSCPIMCIDPGFTRTLKLIGFPPTAIISHKWLLYSILGVFLHDSFSPQSSSNCSNMRLQVRVKESNKHFCPGLSDHDDLCQRLTSWRTWWYAGGESCSAGMYM